ncbi:MAG: hypothetical protein OJF52_002764 [Nitrospira sp.]|nr:MAG: hypothetical protein OJF52_002764 [Nitrospira sp.]
MFLPHPEPGVLDFRFQPLHTVQHSSNQVPVRSSSGCVKALCLKMIGHVATCCWERNPTDVRIEAGYVIPYHGDSVCPV